MPGAGEATGNEDSVRALEQLDALAATWTAAAQPIEFRIATPPELDDVFRLRYRTTIEEGWARPEDFPDGVEYDVYDERSIHVVGLDGPRLAAASRLVLPVSGQPLPTEEAFDLTLPRPTQVVELNRVVVASGYRDGGHRIFAGLLGRSWQEARARGFDGIVGSVSPRLLGRYEQLGVRLEILGPGRRYWGEDRLPICLDTRGTATVPAHSVEPPTQTI